MAVIQTHPSAAQGNPSPAVASSPFSLPGIADSGASGGAFEHLFAQLVQQVQAKLQGPSSDGEPLPIDGDSLPPEMVRADLRAELGARLRDARPVEGELSEEQLVALVDQAMARLAAVAEDGDLAFGELPFQVAASGAEALPVEAEIDQGRSPQAPPAAPIAAADEVAVAPERVAAADESFVVFEAAAPVAGQEAAGEADVERSVGSDVVPEPERVAGGRQSERDEDARLPEADVRQRDSTAARDRTAPSTPPEREYASEAPAGSGEQGVPGDVEAGARELVDGRPVPSSTEDADAAVEPLASSPLVAAGLRQSASVAGTVEVSPRGDHAAGATSGPVPERPVEAERYAVRTAEPVAERELKASPATVARDAERAEASYELVSPRRAADPREAPVKSPESGAGRAEPSLAAAFSSVLSAVAAPKSESVLMPPPTLGQLQSAYQAAPSQAPMLTVPQRFGSDAWAPAASQRITWMASQQIGTAELRLDPPELGSLQVRLTLHQDQASLSFTSPHAQVREVLEQQMPRLREMLAESGIDLQQSDVSDQGANQESRQFVGERWQEGGEGDHDEVVSGAGATVSSGALSLVDAYA